MKNQIKNDLNNIKNSGQIVINTAISNDNGSRQYRASDVIEKGKSTNFMKREEIFAVLGAVASGVTIVDFLFNRLGENAVLKLGKILYEAFIEHNTALNRRTDSYNLFWSCKFFSFSERNYVT